MPRTYDILFLHDIFLYVGVTIPCIISILYWALSWESSATSFRSIKPIYLVFQKLTPTSDCFVKFGPKQQDCRQDMITNKFISDDITGYIRLFHYHDLKYVFFVAFCKNSSYLDGLFENINY